MSVQMVMVPLRGAVEEHMVDRRTGRSWTVNVEPFELAATVVTRGLWDEVQGVTGAPAFANLPKTEVSWREAILFCNALSVMDGLAPVYEVSEHEAPAPTQWRPHSEPEADEWMVTWDHGADGYRLPTDAEWQVACRAGTTGARYGELDDVAWYENNSGGNVHPVQMKSPNPWGLFDMLGDVWEWCWDLYDPAVYGAYRIIRGGGWSDPEWSCRAGVRRKTDPIASFDDLGFRVARGAVSFPAVRPI
ncbi:formylglycine-generating enzyme family protein [uncultured Bifidobacterium sp.]|uniref:formylglycine-generating enzyme family protein n=1 Tax=uncultured Bifidobacterium sp. TaxID=165187 RepID=UPI0028DC1AF6|nr:formylglycine-generating enzyme family protein [uncultured Bifidobacterium sp.]